VDEVISQNKKERKADANFDPIDTPRNISDRKKEDGLTPLSRDIMKGRACK